MHLIGLPQADLKLISIPYSIPQRLSCARVNPRVLCVVVSGWHLWEAISHPGAPRANEMVPRAKAIFRSSYAKNQYDRTILVEVRQIGNRKGTKTWALVANEGILVALLCYCGNDSGLDNWERPNANFCFTCLWKHGLRLRNSEEKLVSLGLSHRIFSSCHSSIPAIRRKHNVVERFCARQGISRQLLPQYRRYVYA